MFTQISTNIAELEALELSSILLLIVTYLTLKFLNILTSANLGISLYTLLHFPTHSHDNILDLLLQSLDFPTMVDAST